MKINIVEENKLRSDALSNAFKNSEVGVSNSNLKNWFNTNSTRCIIRPCSQLDLIYPGCYSELMDIFGENLYDRIEHFIEEKHEVLEIGSSFMIKIPNSDVYLVNSIVSNEEGSLVEGIRNGLVVADKNNMSSVLILPFESFTSEDKYASDLYEGFSRYKEYSDSLNINDTVKKLNR